MFTLDIFIHLDAVNRKVWTGAPDDRPLTALGLEQAQLMAEHISQRGVDAIVSSPARRCRQSLAALSDKTGLPVRVDEGFCDTHGYRAPAGWGSSGEDGPSPLGGALAAGSAFASFSRLRQEFPEGRVVLCSYGDVVPALFAFVAGAFGAEMPRRTNAKSAVFTIEVDGDAAAMATTEAWADSSD
jgi:broad specificity phosphatase PhoE